MTHDILYPDEIKQSERQATLNKLLRLQAKARQRQTTLTQSAIGTQFPQTRATQQQAISYHCPNRDRATCGITEGQPNQTQGKHG